MIQIKVKMQVRVERLNLINGLIHDCASKVHPLKQLCLQKDEICLALLLLSPFFEHFREVWNKVDPLTNKVASEEELCLNLRILSFINSKIKINRIQSNCWPH